MHDFHFRGNNLKDHLQCWIDIGTESEILNWIRDGVPIPFTGEDLPRQFHFENREFNRTETLFIKNKIKELLDSNCIIKCKNRPLGVSPISVVPKKNKDFRLIIDLRHLNTFCSKDSIVYEDIKTVIHTLEPNDYLITTDIKNGFHHVGIHPSHQTYLGFYFEGDFYTWQVLPFGACFSPYYFSKILRPVVRYLRQNDLRTVGYVDDFILGESEEHITTKKRFLLKTLSDLGIFVNFEKSNLHLANLKFLLVT